MKAKKDRLLPLKEILFTYLALSKVIYWSETIYRLQASGDFGGLGVGLLTRFFQRDALLILIVILFYLLDHMIHRKAKSSNILKQVLLYVIGFVGMIGLFYIYNWVFSLFVPVSIPSLGELVDLGMILGYGAAIVWINVKYYFKAKEKDTFKAALPDNSADNQLAMLQSLLNSGILTQAEFDHKSEKVRSM